MKKTIAVLILAVLVLAAFPILSVSNAKAALQKPAFCLTVGTLLPQVALSWRHSPGDLVVVGEIQNVGSSFIQNVTLSATALNANGTTLGTSTGFAFVFETATWAKGTF